MDFLCWKSQLPSYFSTEIQLFVGYQSVASLSTDRIKPFFYVQKPFDLFCFSNGKRSVRKFRSFFKLLIIQSWLWFERLRPPMFELFLILDSLAISVFDLQVTHCHNLLTMSIVKPVCCTTSIFIQWFKSSQPWYLTTGCNHYNQQVNKITGKKLSDSNVDWMEEENSH